MKVDINKFILCAFGILDGALTALCFLGNQPVLALLTGMGSVLNFFALFLLIRSEPSRPKLRVVRND